MADGDGTTAGAQGAGDEGATNTTQQGAGTGTPAPAAPAAPAAGEQVDVAALQAENERLKKEAENARVKAKGAVADQAKRDQLLALASAIGIELPKGEEETVESLQEKLTAEAKKSTDNESALANERRARAVDRAAWTNQVPADKADYLEFLLSKDAEFQGLDPAASDFQTSVAARVKALTDADPTFKATPGGAGRSGAESFGGAGGSGEVSQADFDKMSILEQTKLFQTNPELFQRLAGTA